LEKPGPLMMKMVDNRGNNYWPVRMGEVYEDEDETGECEKASMAIATAHVPAHAEKEQQISMDLAASYCTQVDVLGHAASPSKRRWCRLPTPSFSARLISAAIGPLSKRRWCRDLLPAPLPGSSVRQCDSALPPPRSAVDVVFQHQAWVRVS